MGITLFTTLGHAVPGRPRWRQLWRGFAATGAVAVASVSVAAVETRLFGHPVVEALVVALLLGMLVRLAWAPSEAYRPGIRFAGKQLL